jgi:hypothetical protein
MLLGTSRIAFGAAHSPRFTRSRLPILYAGLDVPGGHSLQPQQHTLQAARRADWLVATEHVGPARGAGVRPSASSAPQPSAARAQASQNCVSLCCCLLLVLDLPP